MKVWHYTTRETFEEIGISREIKPTSIGIEKGEKPAVWFSTNHSWEETVRKRLQDPKTGKVTPALSRDGLLKAGISPVRIEVDPGLPFLTWQEFKKKSGISKKFAKGLERSAKEWGANSDEWRALFSPISIDHWLVVEIWDGKSWVVWFSRFCKG